mgnify:CR=1 FL=1
MIKTAIILAAGMGIRISDIIHNIPKCFINIGEKTLIEYSIEKLIASGIEEIIIGTGYADNKFNDIIDKYKIIKTIKNYDYENTSSMATLFACLNKCNNDALVLESDLLYDSIGLHVLINSPYSNLMLLSGVTNSTDEVWVEKDNNNFLKNLSKDKSKINNFAGELVGITKLSKEFQQELISLYNSNVEFYKKQDYESVIAEVSKKTNSKVKLHKIENYVWCEIDCLQHLDRAKNYIFPLLLENEQNRKIKRNILLNPGPATTTDSVKYAQTCADICPREDEFGNIMNYISNELSLMVGNSDEIETVLFGGSGTAANEAMISSCVPNNAKLLVLNNGAYGERLSKIASIYNLTYDEYKSSEYEPVNIEHIESKFKTGKYTHFAMVYHETTTGLLNPAPQICNIAKQYNVITMIDAISAFAAINIDLINDGFDFMTSTSNKNIQGMAGISFVFCNKNSLENIKNYPMKNYYLNLYQQYEYFKNTKQMRFTPPVQTIYALRQAIIETKIETIEKRYKRYIDCYNVLKESVQKIGLQMIVEEQYQSKLITAIIEPQNSKYNFNDFHNEALKLGFTIYPGKLSCKNTFRIANIGDIYPKDMKRFTEFLEEYFLFLKTYN